MSEQTTAASTTGMGSSNNAEDEVERSSKLPSTPKDLATNYAKWDRLAKEVEEQEAEEEDGVDTLFKKIYRDANDEVKKAMVKSFTESQGTVLSTNWTEVKKDHVEMKPPEGSEFKPFQK